MSSSESKLPARAEALLSDFPVPERDWEAFASKIVDRAQTAGPSEAPDLTKPPALVAELGEPAEASAKIEPAPKSLAALARASVKKKEEAAKDIALESMAAASQGRAQVDEIAQRLRASRASSPSHPGDATATPLSVPPPSLAAPSSMAPPSAAFASEPPASLQQAPPARPASRVPWLISGVAALAAAAALVLALKKPTTETEYIVSPSTQSDRTPTGEKVSGNIGASRGSEATAEEKASPLPEAERPRAGGGAVAQVAPKAGAGAGAKAAASSAPGVSPEALVLEDEAAKQAPPPEEAAPAPAAPVASPPAEPAMRPAEKVNGPLPDRPSSGAVNAAIGSAMGAARKCITDDKPSPVTVVFGSDGNVTSVKASGSGAACIEKAFRNRAHVPPFAAASFPVPTTVRP